jgi:hypothetical protein
VHFVAGFAGMAPGATVAWSLGSFAPPSTGKFIIKTAVWGVGLGTL